MNIRSFFTVLVVLIVVDYLWIGIVAKGFYAEELSELGSFENGRLKVVYWAALVVYLLLATGICAFVLPRAEDSIRTAFIYGAGLGLVTYGIYDFTNYATLKSYSLKLLFADLGWGTFVCGFTAAVAVLAKQYWK